MKGLTFSERVKEELSNLSLDETDILEKEFLGFMKARGNYDLFKRRYTINIGNISASRRFIQIVEKLTGEKLEKMSVGVRELDKRKRVNITLPDGVFKDWSIQFDSERISRTLGDDPIFFGAFLRGFFLAAGSISNPRKHYHFELVTFDPEILNFIKESLRKLLGVNGNVVKLRYNHRLYYKSSKSILEILHLMEAKKSALEFERIMNEKAAKGDTNRTINFISANSNRSGESIVKQINAIRKIEKTIGIEKLPEDLRRVALTRLENEDLSLRELGELLNMSKMMVYNRIKKIMKIAEEIG